MSSKRSVRTFSSKSPLYLHKKRERGQTNFSQKGVKNVVQKEIVFYVSNLSTGGFVTVRPPYY